MPITDRLRKYLPMLTAGRISKQQFDWIIAYDAPEELSSDELLTGQVAEVTSLPLDAIKS